MAEGNVGIWGWDDGGPLWRKIHVDAAGHLQTDILSSALPTGAATAANQATIIGHIDGLEGALGQCYGWDGANWQTLLVESAAQKNLRVRLYDGANGIDSFTFAGGVSAPAIRGLPVVAATYGWDLTNMQPVSAFVPSDAHSNAPYCLVALARLQGYNGATWDRLRMESAALHNLRVKLYDGANGIDAIYGSDNISTEYGLKTNACLYGLESADSWRPIAAKWANSDDRVPNTSNLLTMSFLYGFDGTNWDRLRVDGAFRLLTNSMLYDGANAIDSDLIDANIFVSGERALLVRAQVCGYNLEPFLQRRTDSDNIAAVSRELCLMTISALYGYDGSTFDRLRTYGTGILKVGRAEVGMSTRVIQTGTQVKASGGMVFWITIMVQDSNRFVYVMIKDGGVPGAIRWMGGHQGAAWTSFHAVFDPPIETSTDIFIDLQWDGAGAAPYVTVGYL